MINFYRDYGNCYLISLNKSVSFSLIFDRLRDFKGKIAYCFSDDDFYYLILCNTFNRPAYDFYYDINGSSIMKLEPVTAGALLEVFKDCHNPCYIRPVES